jgi:hypothetical protein
MCIPRFKSRTHSAGGDGSIPQSFRGELAKPSAITGRAIKTTLMFFA